MAWPAGGINESNLDASSDSPDAARPDLLAAVQQLNDVIDSRGIPSGIASLNAQGQVPSGQLSASTLLQLIATVDGSGSLLDADLLDGLNSTDFVRTNGSQSIAGTGVFGIANVDTISAVQAANTRDVLSIGRESSGGSTPLDGFGGALVLSADDAGGVSRNVARLKFFWEDVSSEDASVELFVRKAGSISDANSGRFKFTHEGGIQLREVVTPAHLPPSGYWAMYFTAAGLTIHDGSSETVLGSGTVTDHGSLTGLADQSDHTWALTLDGSRVMTGDLQFGQFGALFTDLAGDPGATDPNKVVLYARGQRLYYQINAGTVFGPLDTGGGASDHGGLTGLADNDHPQYLLAQPAANVVWNEAGGDFDLRMEGASLQHLWKIDAGLNTVSVNVTSPVAGKRFQVTATSTDEAIYAISASGAAIEASAAAGIGVHATSLDGKALQVNRAGTSSDWQATIDDESSGTGGVLFLRQHTAGRKVLDVQDDAAKSLLYMDTDNTYFNNDKEADKTFIVRGGAGFDDLFRISSADNTVNVNTPSSTIGTFNVVGGDGFSAAAFIQGHSSNPNALLIAPTGGVGLNVTSAVTGSVGAYIQSNDSSSLWIKKTATSSGVRTPGLLVDYVAGSSAAVGLFNTGTGDYLSGFSKADGSEAEVRLMKGGTMELREQSSVSAPSDGWWRFYFKSDGAYIQNDLTETKLTAGVGATPGAPDRSVQVNVSGAFTGNGNLLWTASDILAVIGGATITKTSGFGLDVTASGTAWGQRITQSGTGRAIEVTSTGTAEGLYVKRNNAAPSVSLAFIHEDHASSSKHALEVRQDGTGDIFRCADGTTLVFSVNDGGSITLQPLAAAPSGTEGDFYSDSVTNKAYYHNGSGWVSIIEAGSGTPGGSAAGEIQFWATGPVFDATSALKWAAGTTSLDLTGDARISGEARSNGIVLSATPLTDGFAAADRQMRIIGTGNTSKVTLTGSGVDGTVQVNSTGSFSLSGDGDAESSVSVKITRAAAGVLGVKDGSGADAGINCGRIVATDYLAASVTETGAAPTTDYAGWFEATWNPSVDVTVDYNALRVRLKLDGGSGDNFTPPSHLAAARFLLEASPASGSTISEAQVIDIDMLKADVGTLTLASAIRIQARRTLGTLTEARGLYFQASSGSIGTESPIYSEWNGASYFLARVQTDESFDLKSPLGNLTKILAGTSGTAWTLALPDDGGSFGQVLQTDGGGVSSWVTQTLAHGASNGLIQMTDGSGLFTSNAALKYDSGVLTTGLIFADLASFGSGAGGEYGLLIKGHASQTEDLLQITTSVPAVLFAVASDGKIKTDQANANTNTPSGATANALPFYDEFGVLLGYVPCYAVEWS